MGTPTYSPGHLWLVVRRLNPDVANAFRNSLCSLHDSVVLARFEPKLTQFKPALAADYDALEQELEKAELFDQPR